jgi:hypothetical protein
MMPNPLSKVSLLPARPTDLPLIVSLTDLIQLPSSEGQSMSSVSDNGIYRCAVCGD